MNPRAVAAKVITQVVHSATQLNHALVQHLSEVDRVNDQPLVQELSYGVLRWWPVLDALTQALLKKTLKAKDADVLSLLWVGLYQLKYTRVPAHAAVAETVAAVRQLKKPWADKLINAVLRGYLRQAEPLGVQINKQEVVLFAHPQWFIDRLKSDWPQHWQSILEANNLRPPMTLRINRLKIQRENYLKLLAEQHVQATPSVHSDVGVTLNQALAVERVPGFGQGLVSVQDGAAQLAAGLLQLQAGQRVLDVCAAPGGKTAHVLELQPQLQQLTAVDVDANRIARIQENLDRLGLSATLVCADATQPQSWWDGQLFDRILLDAPCSATGVIRRHPDIKILRTPEQLLQITQLQAQLLDSVWPLLQPGGMLLYGTCSILPQENETQIAAFVERTEDACYQEFDVDWGMARPYGRQIFPGEQVMGSNADTGAHGDSMDGFYYAGLLKRD